MVDPAAVNDAEAFRRFLGDQPSPVADLVRAADELIRSVHPEVTQVLWSHQRTIGYGVGPKKMSQHYAYVDVYDEHVNLGFNHGSQLADPSRILGGSGKRFRNVRIQTVADLERPELRTMIEDAVVERRAALGM